MTMMDGSPHPSTDPQCDPPPYQTPKSDMTGTVQALRVDEKFPHYNQFNDSEVTALMHACQQGQGDSVRQIINKDRTVLQQRDKTGKSALHYCAENSSLSCLEQLLKEDPTLLSARDEEGYTPLHLGVIAGNRSVVKYLLSKGADIHARDNEKHTVVHWATVCGEVDILELLVESGANPGTPDIHGAYPIHYAAQMCGPNSALGKDVESGLRVLQKLLQKGVDVTVKDHDGRQPLLWAASAEVRPSHVYCPSGSADAILALVNAGADIAADDKDGLTALHCAASRGHLDCLDILITLCSAEVDTLDANGCTPLFYAVTLGHADCTDILLKYGAITDRQDRKGRTPAHCGAAKGQLETLKLLQRRGADLWKRNIKGDLPLHEACQSGRMDLILWLLSLQPMAVNAPNNDGRCPLHIAMINGNIGVAKILMDYKANVNPIMRNTKGQLITPVDAAVARGNIESAKYLQLHGGLPATKLTDKRALQIAMQQALEIPFPSEPTGATPSDLTGEGTEASTSLAPTPSTVAAFTPSGLTIAQHASPSESYHLPTEPPVVSKKLQNSETFTSGNYNRETVIEERKKSLQKMDNVFHSDDAAGEVTSTKPNNEGALKKKSDKSGSEPGETVLGKNGHKTKETTQKNSKVPGKGEANERLPKTEGATTHRQSKQRQTLKPRKDSLDRDKRVAKNTANTIVVPSSREMGDGASDEGDRGKTKSEAKLKKVRKEKNSTKSPKESGDSSSSSSSESSSEGDEDESEDEQDVTSPTKKLSLRHNTTTIRGSQEPISSTEERSHELVLSETTTETSIGLVKDAQKSQKVSQKSLNNKKDILNAATKKGDEFQRSSSSEDDRSNKTFQISKRSQKDHRSDEVTQKTRTSKSEAALTTSTMRKSRGTPESEEEGDLSRISNKTKPRPKQYREVEEDKIRLSRISRQSQKKHSDRSLKENGEKKEKLVRNFNDYEDDFDDEGDGDDEKRKEARNAKQMERRKLDKENRTRKPDRRRVMSAGPRKVESIDKDLQKYPPMDMSITQAIQTSVRKYAMERRLFQQLLDLKRFQIRNSRANEYMLIKRLVDEYNADGGPLGLGPYTGPMLFPNYEKHLYDQLRKLQWSQGNRIPPFKSDADVEKLTKALRKAGVPDLERPMQELIDKSKDKGIGINSCSHSTHRCHHVLHAYTGIPCAAYLAQCRRTLKNDKGETLPRIGPYFSVRDSEAAIKNGLLKNQNFELQQGRAKQPISIPTNAKEKNNKYQSPSEKESKKKSTDQSELGSGSAPTG